MAFWTAQISQWRLVQDRGIILADTTVKSAVEYEFLAPTWTMVMNHKGELITDEMYTEQYLALLRDRYGSWRRSFYDLLELGRDSEVAIACYCSPGKFCHRHLSINVLRKIAEKANLPFEYKGEITR